MTKTLLALTLALAIAAPAVAQVRDDTTRLAPIVVTATRTPLPANALGNSVTVLEGTTLRAQGVTTVLEALRGVPSLTFAQAGSRGAQTSMFLRGGESDYVRVLRDGVPLNQAGGAIDLANLTLDNVERIEIVRGPASVLYGSDAMTGVIQIITRRGGGPRLDAGAGGGERGTGRAEVEVALGGPRLGVTAGAQRETARGVYAINNSWGNSAASVGLAARPDERTDLRLTASYRDGAYHYPTDGAGAPVDSNAFGRSRQALVSLDAGRRITRAVELRALLGFMQGRDSTQDAPDSPGDTLSGSSESRRGIIRRTADLRANIQAGAQLLLTAGASVERQRERDRSSFTFPGFGTSPSSTEGDRTNRALYLQAVTGQGPIAIQAGARLDDNQRFGTFRTWRAGASLRAAAGTRLRAGAGTAFKEPTFDENVNTAFSIGNPDLRPEQSRSLELGLDQAIGTRASASVTGFTQHFRDLIQYSYGAGGPDYQNVGAADASGVELQLTVHPLARLRLAAQYTYLHTESRDSSFLSPAGQPLLRRPAHSASLDAAWSTGGTWSLGGRALYTGWRADVGTVGGTTTRVSAPPFTRIDAWGSATVLRTTRGSLALTLRVDNVAGLKYQEVYGFRAPGRVIVGGMRLEAR